MISRPNGGFRPLAPSNWHGTTKTRPQEGPCGKAGSIAPSCRIVNPQGRRDLRTWNDSDILGSNVVETLDLPGHVPNGGGRDARSTHAIYANKVDTDEDEAQELRRLGKLYGT